MGFLTSKNIWKSVYLMRILTAAIAVAAAIAVLGLAPMNLRKAGIIGLLLGGGPSGWFYVSSTNPSGWAFIGVGLFWIAFGTYLTAETAMRRHCGLALAIGLACLACAARGDAGAFICISMLVMILVYARPRRHFLRLMALGIPVMAITAIALSSFFLSGESTHVASGAGGHAASLDATSNFFYNITQTFGLAFGAAGNSPLGWDTYLPDSIQYISLIVIVMLCSWALLSASRTMRVIWAALLLFTLVIPALTLAQLGLWADQFGQARYMLPLLPIAFGAIFLRETRGESISIPRIYLWIFGIGVSLVNAIALYVNIERYSRGVGKPGPVDLSAGSVWWPTTLISPMSTWIVGTLALGIVVVVSVTKMDKPLSKSVG